MMGEGGGGGNALRYEPRQTSPRSRWQPTEATRPPVAERNAHTRENQ